MSKRVRADSGAEAGVSKKQSKKALKKAADAHFEARFAPPKDEPLWDESSVGLDDDDDDAFWRSIGCPARAVGAVPDGGISVRREAARCAESTRLRKALASLCGDKYPSMCFERWHLAAADSADAGTDPLLPTNAAGDAGAAVLRADLEASKHAPADVARIVAAHLKAVEAASKRVARFATGDDDDDGASCVATTHGGEVTLAMGSTRLVLPEAVYAKLVTLATRSLRHPKKMAGGIRTDVDVASARAIFLLVRRYDVLGGSGFQAALPARAFFALRDLFGVSCECFASPLNCFFGRFCSAFGEGDDVDAAFGSLGSFWRFEPRRGAFEVNPPFAPAPLQRAAAKCVQLLDAAEAAAEDLCVCFVAPAWTDGDCWRTLEASAHNTGVCRVKREDHAWRDTRTAQARRVPVDTAIFILQTTAAAAGRPCDENRLKALDEALRVPQTPP